MSLNSKWSHLLEIDRGNQTASYIHGDEKVQPVSDVICYVPGYYDERTNKGSQGWLILDVPGHEHENGSYESPKYQVWWIYDDIDNYWRGKADPNYEIRSCDLYHEIPKSLSSQPVNFSDFVENVDFKNDQLHVYDPETRKRIKFRYMHTAEDGMPAHRPTNVYSVYFCNKKIGECYGSRSGKYVVDPDTLRGSNDPGSPAFFYYTLMPMRDVMKSIGYCTATYDHHCDEEYEWDNGVAPAWYPTFNTLSELLECHLEQENV